MDKNVISEIIKNIDPVFMETMKCKITVCDRLSEEVHTCNNSKAYVAWYRYCENLNDEIKWYALGHFHKKTVDALFNLYNIEERCIYSYVKLMKYVFLENAHAGNDLQFVPFLGKTTLNADNLY